MLILPVVGSTMNVARTLAQAGADHGTVIVAKRQLKGRGRTAAWQSDRGGAYLTTILRGRPERPGLVPLAAGLAIAEHLRELGLKPRLRWPNDVLLDGKKVAGILVESAWGEDTTVLVGMGINITNPVPDVGTRLVDHGLQPTVQAIAHHVSRHLLAIWQDLKDVPHAWPSFDALAGQAIERDGVKGTARGIDEHGHLIIETDEGPVHLDQPIRWD